MCKSVKCESCGGPARKPLQHSAPVLCRHCHFRFTGRPEGDEINPEVSEGNASPQGGSMISKEDGDGNNYPSQGVSASA